LSKTKNKNRSELETLRGENRQLHKKIKQLMKYHRIHENIEEIQKELISEESLMNGYTVNNPRKVTCPSCHEGEFKLVIDLTDKEIYNCTDCDFKKVVKK